MRDSERARALEQALGDFYAKLAASYMPSSRVCWPTSPPPVSPVEPTTCPKCRSNTRAYRLAVADVIDGRMAGMTSCRDEWHSRMPMVSPVEPEPPTNPPCVRCGHALSAHRPEFGACDGRERPCACPEYQVPTVEPEPCMWREDEDGIWETSCGASWVFTDGSPSENNTKFCHNCGHPVQPVAYVERFEDDEDEAGAPMKVEREP